jgi:uncharacterized membrane protein
MDKKPFWQSKTLWGLVCLATPNVLAVIDSWFGTKLSSPELTSALTTIGGVLGVKGRMDANTTLGVK